MTVKQMLEDLNSQIDIYKDGVDQANLAYRDAQKKFELMTKLSNNTYPITKIDIVNSEGPGRNLTTFTRHYRLDDQVVLFTINDFLAFDHDIGYIGQIINCSKGAVIYACKFYEGYYEEKEELFDCLLTNYIQWRFEL